MKSTKTHSKDINQIAKMVVGLATGDKESKKLQEAPKSTKKDTNKPLRK
jgi:hypothetical protein